MIVISHRGNLRGPNKEEENRPSYIKLALRECDFVEVDIWIEDGVVKMGHDHGQYDLDVSLFKEDRIIWHAKNLEALKFLKYNNLHYFFHDADEYTITSKHLIWAHPSAKNFEGCICVLPEIKYGRDFLKKIDENVLGVCTDFPMLLKEGKWDL